MGVLGIPGSPQPPNIVAIYAAHDHGVTWSIIDRPGKIVDLGQFYEGAVVIRSFTTITRALGWIESRLRDSGRTRLAPEVTCIEPVDD